MTLVEVVIYAAVLAIIGAPIVTMSLGTTRATTEVTRHSRLIERNRSAVQRVADDLRSALAGSLYVAPDGASVSYAEPGSFDGTGPAGGDTILYYFGTVTYPDGTTDDTLVRYDYGTATSFVVAADVDVANSAFTPEGTGVRITFSTIGPGSNGSNTPTRMTQSVIVTPRN